MGSDTDDQKVRFRRTKSVTRADDIKHREVVRRKSQNDKPCHQPRDSLFSWSSGFDNFAGLVNWGFLLLTMGGIRLFLENLIKYGIRIDPVQWFIVISGKHEGEGHPSGILIIYSLVPIVTCLLLEKGLSIEIISEKFGMYTHIANILLLVLIPMGIIHVQGHTFSLIGATTVCVLYSILFMKIWSYVQVNMWCRNQQKIDNKKNKYDNYFRARSQSISIAELQSEERQNHNSQLRDPAEVDEDENDRPFVQYPDNLNVKDFIYFLLVPTLCYELNFPRTSRIRKRFLLKRALEVIIGINVIMGIFQQWMIPSVKNSLIPFSNMDLAKATERLLKLAIPNHLSWLCFFYLTFHSFLNMVGELLHFADRNFYCDWWNANNIDVFWRTWNMPVHKWCVRHVYIPVVELGYSKTIAFLLVFFISAFFHEFIVSVPLKMFKIWAFMGMMSQIPLSYLTKWVEKKAGPRWGNIIVWTSIILGQPLCVMMYYHDYVVTNYNEAIQNS